MKIILDKDILYQLYVVEQKGTREIGKILGVSKYSVSKNLKLNNIEVRPSGYQTGHSVSQEVRDKISKGNKGKLKPRPKMQGMGSRFVDNNGYIRVYYPTHPHCDNGGNVREHVMLMEKKIGRLLEKDEVVHHINGNKQDNRIENLQLMTRSEHMKLHNKLRRERKALCQQNK